MKKYFFSLFGKQHEIQNKLLAYIEHTEAMALTWKKRRRSNRCSISSMRARILETICDIAEDVGDRLVIAALKRIL